MPFYRLKKKTETPPNIVDIAAGSDDFDLLVRALDAAGLTQTVREAGDITVFAPTDAAFTQLAVDLGFDGDTHDEDAVFDSIVASLTDLAADGDPIPLLTDILLYHVSGGAKTAAEIDALDSVETLLDGATFGSEGTELIDNEPDIANPNIVAPDIAAANGTIQGIDRVLLPLDIPGNTPPPPPPPTLTLTGIVAESGGTFDDNPDDFDLLLNAVTIAGLDDDLDMAGADLTVFAPTDAAFIGLAMALGFDGEGEGEAFAYIVEALTLLSGGGDPVPLLTDILLYHVASGTLDSGAVLAADSIPTLLGSSVGVDGVELVDADPDVPNPELIATDILATNGIAHVIDGVLLPVDILNGDGGRGRVDFKIGDDGKDVFVTGANTDFVSGLGGRDKIFLGRGDDVGLGGDGGDKVFGGKGDDIVDGGDGGDRLFGGRGKDEIDGGAGNDVIRGGIGGDHLTGGEDADRFVFNLFSGDDTVTDFTSGEDVLVVRSWFIRKFRDIERRIEEDGDDAILHIGFNDITLEGVSADSLTRDDFQFV